MNNPIEDHAEVNDEFKASIEEGIEDESLLQGGNIKKFSITSYGADYTVDSLVSRMDKDAFKIPTFQRKFIWSITKASKFIESLLMGLPVPGIFLYKEQETNQHLVIDGQQRLKSLQSFYKGLFGERKFRLRDVRKPWNGKTYEELDTADRLKLDDSIIHATIFSQDEPKDVLDSIYFVFERINSGGIRLSPQEIRNCIAEGSFTALVKELNKLPSWKKIFGVPSKRGKDEELIIRFFAMLEDRENYKRPMMNFLNNFTAKMNKSGDEKLNLYREEFERITRIVDESLAGRAFRPARNLNAAVYDATMVGIAERLRITQQIDLGALKTAYGELLDDPDFQKGYVRATADEENVKSRMNAAIRAFQNI